MGILFALILTSMLAATLAVNAACTPSCRSPKVPQISNIQLEPKLDKGWDEILISKEE